MSKTLMRTVPLQVILPVDKFTFGQPEREEKPFKTLYLLHGTDGRLIHIKRILAGRHDNGKVFLLCPSLDSGSMNPVCPEKEKTPLSEAFPWVVLAHSEMA